MIGFGIDLADCWVEGVGYARQGEAEGDRWAVRRGEGSAGGYWLVEAESKEELVKWAERRPAEEGDVIEIRQVFDLAEFGIKT
jgi:hypothetical protein